MLVLISLFCSRGRAEKCGDQVVSHRLIRKRTPHIRTPLVSNSNSQRFPSRRLALWRPFKCVHLHLLHRLLQFFLGLAVRFLGLVSIPRLKTSTATRVSTATLRLQPSTTTAARVLSGSTLRNLPYPRSAIAAARDEVPLIIRTIHPCRDTMHST